MEINENSRLLEALHELRMAAIRGDPEGARSALSKGVPVNQPLQGGLPALLFACSQAHPTTVLCLLRHGANPNCHKDRFTPLMAVCASTQQDEDRLVQCAELLLLYKANVNAVERHNMTALMLAAKEGRARVVAHLLAANCHVDAQDNQGWTAMSWAVSRGQVKAVEALLRGGARIDLPDNIGQTVLHLANAKRNKQIIDILTRAYNQESLDPLIGLADKKGQFMKDKGTDSVLQALLREMFSSVNNNGRFDSNFTQLLNSKGFENNFDVLKTQLTPASKLTNNNNSFQNAMVLSNKCSQNSVVKEDKAVEISQKNIPYSVLEAREVLCQLLRRVEALYASVSCARLHMQGCVPIALLDKHARTPEVIQLASRALHSTKVLYDELYFFHRYAKQLEESESVVPAEVVTQRPADSQSSVVCTCVLVTAAAAALVILFNNKLLTISFFSS